MTWLSEYQGKSRLRRRRAERAHKRLDVQGLRMVAVLTVFANHLCGWPRGGFVGVDVFFVISGFLITGNLLRTAETTGTVSFKGFYWNRIRRIVPAATVVLIVTFVASTLVFLPFRSHQVGVDALFAFVFFANWHFAFQETNYFAGGNAVSPIQHFWSLSIEEQFYFVWPALIFVVSVLVVRKSWGHAWRMAIAGVVMGAIVAASLRWALRETGTSPTWAYFNTFARVWELGVGALLAIAVGLLARIPQVVRPWLSWSGVVAIVASLVLISDHSTGFPAPWALLPVGGAALVIAAGVGKEPKYQEFLRNPLATYIGDISYSLYLVHWPIIVVAAALMDPSPYYYVTVVTLSLGLAVASYHGVENPLRHADQEKIHELTQRIRKGTYWPEKPGQYAMFATLALLAVALVSYIARPDYIKQAAAPPIVAAAGAANTVETADPAGLDESKMPPLTAALQDEIAAALKAADWPTLDPSMESVITGPEAAPEVTKCGALAQPDPQSCTWGPPDAPIRIVLVGDSVALSYANPLRLIALNSNGQIQVHTEVLAGCQFVDDLIVNRDQRVVDECPARKQLAIDVINTTKPNVVIVSNSYGGQKQVVGSSGHMSMREWSDSMQRIVQKFQGSTQKVVLLSAPPADVLISDCYGNRSSTPADCISKVTNAWSATARTEQAIAESIGGTWITSLPWFCFRGLCPSFVGTTPTKHDLPHMSPAYGEKIYPVIKESLQAAGVL